MRAVLLIALIGFAVGAVGALLFLEWPFSSLAYTCPFCFSFDFDASARFLVALASAFALMKGSLYGLIGFSIGNTISRTKTTGGKPGANVLELDEFREVAKQTAIRCPPPEFSRKNTEEPPIPTFTGDL
jgi:hypothetical protein